MCRYRCASSCDEHAVLALTWHHKGACWAWQHSLNQKCPKIQLLRAVSSRLQKIPAVMVHVPSVTYHLLRTICSQNCNTMPHSHSLKPFPDSNQCIPWLFFPRQPFTDSHEAQERAEFWPEESLEHVVVHASCRGQTENLEEEGAAELEQDLGSWDASVDSQIPDCRMWSATCCKHTT